jgi:hypothetical protein
MVIGGTPDGQQYNPIEIIDVRNPFSLCIPPAIIPEAMSSMAAGFDHGQLYVCGGQFEEEQFCFTYEESTRSWTPATATLNIARTFAAASTVNDRLVISGGSNHNCPLRTIETLSLNQENFEVSLFPNWAQLMSGHCQATGIRSDGEQYVLFAGGFEGPRAFLYSTTRQSWSLLTQFVPVPTSYAGYTSCGTIKNSEGQDEVFLVSRGESAIFSFETFDWRFGPTVDIDDYHEVVEVNGTIAVFGGRMEDFTGPTKKIFLLNKDTMEFERFPRDLLFEHELPGVAIAVPDSFVDCET